LIFSFHHLTGRLEARLKKGVAALWLVSISKQFNSMGYGYGS
jgi:hypothetical protein